MKISQFIYPVAAALLLTGFATTVAAKDFVQDAEYYVLEAQHGDAWAAEDKELKKRLAVSKLPFDPLEYVEHLDQLLFDRNMDPSL